MNLRDLEYLVAVADRGSFRQAALSCEVSQPTLSTQIKKLETELGVTLIDRSIAPLALTPVGEHIVARARLILDEVRQLKQIAAAEAQVEAVRLGFFPTLGPYLLPHIVPTVRDRMPQVELLLTEEKTAVLLDMLDAGELDAALVALPDGVGRFESLPLFREEFLLATPVNHRLSGTMDGPRVSASEVVGEELLLLSHGHCLADQVADWVTDVGASAREDYRATSLETMRNMIRAGNGLTLLPALTVLPQVTDTSGIGLRRFEPPTPSRTIALTWRKSSPAAPTLQKLAPCLVPQVEADGMITKS